MVGREIGRWIVERELRQGGMGEVFLARHKTLGTQAVLKVLSGMLHHDEKFRERFQQEAQTQAQLHHPHIVQVLDFFDHDGQWFLVTEFMTGGNLEEAIEKANGPIPIPQALRWTLETLEALDVAHQKGIIHRDMKPANLMLDANKRVKVTDFGIAVVIGGRRMTVAGQVMGTPAYMSPEQIKTPTKVDHRTDVYSMGIVLYELLSGKVPFDSESDFEIRQSQVSSVPARIRTLNPAIPEELDAIVQKALAKNPDDRYSGCGEMAKAITAFLGHGPPEIPAANALEKPPDKPGKSEISGSLIAAILLSLALIVLVVFCADLNGKLNSAKARNYRLSNENTALKSENAELKSKITIEITDGSLTTSDEVWNQIYLDRYNFSVATSQVVIVEVRSSDFDPKVWVKGPSDQEMRVNDDGGLGDSALIVSDSRSVGNWVVVVGSIGNKKVGSYKLYITKY